jgi:hypothetical protein
MLRPVHMGLDLHDVIDRYANGFLAPHELPQSVADYREFVHSGMPKMGSVEEYTIEMLRNS